MNNKERQAETYADYSIQPIAIPSANLAANPLLADALGSLPSFHDTFMKDMCRKVTSEWNAKLKAYIQDNLKQFGHTFETDTDFFEFCKNRIHRLAFTENPNYYEFYLDFVDVDDKGTFIGSCSDAVLAVVILGKDTSNQNIIPVRDKLVVKTNAHHNCDGSRWGWIEGCSLNICWSNENSKFNKEKADELVRLYNDR